MKFGKYHVIDKLGEGGMAEIFLVRFETPGGISKTCVVKAIHQELISEKEFRDAFYDEARVALTLSHGNLVQTFDFGDADGSLYLAMEWCDAGDLDDLMTALARRGERLPVETACHIMTGLLTGLSYAHYARDTFDNPLELVHRDISPPNVLLTFAGEIKLSDFGIARAAQRLVSTGFGVVKGKPAYLAPEQAAGKRATRHSDIFSAGIVFWEMLVGKHLFTGGDTRRIMESVVASEILRPDEYRNDLPPRLTAIVMRALAKNPDERFESASDFLEEIEAFHSEFGLGYGRANFINFLATTLEKRRNDTGAARMITPALGQMTDDKKTLPRPKTRAKRRRSVALGVAALVLATLAFLLGRFSKPDVQTPTPQADSAMIFALEDTAGVIAHAGEPGALVAIEGRPFGFIPATGNVPVGKRKKKPVRISMPGRRTFTANKIFKAGDMKMIKSTTLRTEIGALPSAQKPRTVAGLIIESGSRMILPTGLYRIVDEASNAQYVRIP
jgi:eukaryotic-like serine/threonine-protein kinase